MGLEPTIYRLEVCRLIQFGHAVYNHINVYLFKYFYKNVFYIKKMMQKKPWFFFTGDLIT